MLYKCILLLHFIKNTQVFTQHRKIYKLLKIDTQSTAEALGLHSGITWGYSGITQRDYPVVLQRDSLCGVTE